MRLFSGIIVFFALTATAQAEEMLRTISVSGSGIVEATPDLARVTLGVQTQARTARDALQNNSQTMTEVMAALKDDGMAPKDIQTSQISLHPRWENRNNTSQIVGYQAVNSVVITARNLDKLGALLDQLSRDGANNIQSITFGLSDREAATDEARKAAVVDARARAELYAAAAGANVGPVLTISESGSRSPSPMAMGRAQMEMAMDVPIAEGTLDVRATVHVVFELVD